MKGKPWWQGVRINPWFVVFILLYVIAGYGRQMAVAFLVVTLHEVTHAIVAEGYGLTVERMEIWPFGGMAEISGLSSQEPYVEAMVAVAGPMQNFMLAALTYLVGPYLPLDPGWADQFMAANLGLGVLNLLPVAPLDGGRLARLYWSRSIGYRAAEQRVRKAGMWLAWTLMAFTAASLVTGRPLLSVGVFAVFLLWGASRSGKQAFYWIIRDLHLRGRAFEHRPVWGVDDFAVRADAALGQVLAVMRPMRYHRVVVLDEELHRLGTLYEEDLLRALDGQGPTVPIGQLLR